MQLYFGYILLVVATLIPIANPFVSAPMFLSLTSNFSKKERQKTATLAAFYMFLFLTCFLLFGAHLLSFFGIQFTSLRIAGGLIIGYLGFKMLFPTPLEMHEETKQTTTANDIAFIPLAMPYMSGPGAISVVITMAAQINTSETLRDEIFDYSIVISGIAVSAFICWIVLSGASKVVKFMGTNGIIAMTKVMGFFLIGIGVDMVLDTILSFTAK
ncbi:MarC family NAAT transporter [Thalassotalea piscium]|uniref:MarC family NAAT transporter n=1 Tax=Thalassotalea piscium TaxID=1230533 RepID=UPI0031ED2167